MEVKLTPDHKAFVRDAIESGRLKREEDAVQEALALWEERERTRAEILAAVDEADASLARGEGRIITQQSMRDLAAEVKQRGRARLAAERTPGGHRVAPRAEAELDGIWYYLAKESGSIEIADRVVDSITARFFLLSR
jgi:Arc/MetJ-type ribon-helix-helix transcriptional regulator